MARPRSIVYPAGGRPYEDRRAAAGARRALDRERRAAARRARGPRSPAVPPSSDSAGKAGAVVAGGRHRDELYEHAPRWVNRQRRKLGKPALGELPPGEPGDFVTCPLALAIGDGACVGFRYAWLPTPDGYGGTYVVPGPVAEFLERYEFGFYPALMAGASASP